MVKGRIQNFLGASTRELQQKTARVIAGILGYKVFAHAFSIVAGILIARKLGPEGKGMVSALFIVPAFISQFGHFGLPVASIYFIGKKRDSEVIFTNVVLCLITSSIIFLGLSIVGLPILNRSYFEGISSPILGSIALCMIPLLLAKHYFIDLLRAIERYNEYNYQSIMQHGSRLILIVVLFITIGANVKSVILASIAALVLSNIYAFVIILKKIPLHLNKASMAQFKESLSYGLREYFGNLMATLNVKIDLLIIAAFMDKSMIGIYSVAIGISELFQFVPSSINVVLLPKISKASSEEIGSILKKSIIANGIILLAGWIFFVLVGWWLVTGLYGDQFKDAYYLTVIILIGSLLLSFVQIINKYFSGVGRPEIKSIVRLLNLPIKAIAMIVLIKLYHLEGAAWSFVITTLSLLVLTLFFFYKCRKSLKQEELNMKVM